MELADFLLARIAEDETEPKLVREGWRDLEDMLPMGAWDSERVLAECEAKRRIVTLAARVEDDDAGPDGYERGYSDGWSGLQIARSALRLLALPYAEHPDFREEWAVS